MNQRAREWIKSAGDAVTIAVTVAAPKAPAPCNAMQPDATSCNASDPPTHEEKCETNPSPRADDAALTLRQHAAARLLVAGLRLTEVASRLGLDRSTLWRWQRLAPFAAEAQRLRAQAAERAVQPTPCNPLQPDATSRNAPAATLDQKCKAKPPAGAASAVVDPAPRRPNPFLETVLRLNREGITPFTRADEYRKRMRQAGYEL